MLPLSLRFPCRLGALMLCIVASLPAQLVNTSVRVRVGAGDDTLITGFVVGATPKTFLFRAVGPTLGTFGVGGVLADPILTLFGANQSVLATNNDWGTNPSYSAATITAVMASAGAFALPAGSRDAVLIATLPSGAYTVQVTGANNGTGVALFEAYELAAVPVAAGTITGRLLDAVSSIGIVGTQIVFRNAAGAEIGRATTRVFGSFEATLPAGAVRVEFPGSTGFVAAFQLGTVVAGVTTELPPLRVAPVAGGGGAIAGRVTSAVTGATLAGVTLQFRNGAGVQTGAVAGTTTSAANGTYTLPLTPGTYTAEVSNPGFIPAFFTVTATAGNAPPSQNFALSPVLGANEFRIVLTWGATPVDLDAHLTGPAPTTGRFHVFFEDEQPAGAGARLDLDDIDSFGPETVTISSFRPGVYRYSVHDYSNRGQAQGTALSSSGAQVVVFRGSGEVARFTAPSGRTGDLWTVFEIDGTSLVLTPRNEFSTITEPVRVTAPPLGGEAPIPATDAETLRIGRKPKR